MSRGPWLAVVLLAVPASAAAQRPVLDRTIELPGVRAGTLRIDAAEMLDERGVRSQQPVPELDPARLTRVVRARAQRWAGRPEIASDTLRALLAEVPHHAVIVTELARAELQRQNWTAVSRLVRAERALAHDSLLAGAEGAMAEERLGHVKEALAIAAEAWAAAASEADWASRLFTRLAPMEPRTAEAALRGAAGPRPWREDLRRGHALLLAHAGDAAGASRVLAGPGPQSSVPLRLRVAEDLLMDGAATARDTAAAREILADAAADPVTGVAWRVSAARRAWGFTGGTPAADGLATRLANGLAPLPPAAVPADFALVLARALRDAGDTGASRALLAPRADASPEVQLEVLLAEAREGPPERALAPLSELAARWPGARFALAEARFWCGEPDSARVLYEAVTQDPSSPDVGAALERLYLLEETQGSRALAGYGRAAYQAWRGDAARARALTDSLLAGTDRGQPLWPHLALLAGEQRIAAGEARAALVPLVALADSLPGDRLASRAGQRAGDAWRLLRDDARALARYEDTLARWPRAWNAPEVRRLVEQLRKDRRF